jgi:hypothetical protein
MSMRRKIIFGILGGIIAIAVIGAIAIKCYLSYGEKAAAQLAKDYLAQKYEQEMQFHYAVFSLADPICYHVVFTPANNPELYFDVIVDDDLTLDEWITKPGYTSSSDDYYLAYFRFHTSREIEKIAQSIWDESASATAPVDDRGAYPYSVPFGFNEGMSAEEMEPFLDYDYYIITNRLLDSESKQKEAQRMLNMIELVQASKYKPEKILFWYKTGKDENEGEQADSKTWAEMYIEFINWPEISSIEEVLQAMDEQWPFAEDDADI